MSQAIDFSKQVELANLKGKSALVTGAASGIGAATAKALAEAGASVTLADKNDVAGKQYVERLQQQGLSVQFQHFEAESWSSQVTAFQTCKQSSRDGRIDFVVSCAGLVGNGLLKDHPFLSSTDSSGDPQPPSTLPFTVNLIGSYYTTILAIYYSRDYVQHHPADVKQKDKPALILIASNIAYSPIPTMTAYAASKAGVRGVWASLRGVPELTGLRMNMLAPHIVRSPMTAGLDALVEARGAKMVEMETVVEALMRMCCDQGIDGRAVGVLPDGSFDFEDDEEGFFGAKAFLERKGATKDVWALMEELLTSPPPGEG